MRSARTRSCPYIERLRDETRIPIVYVSHAVAEVARLATTIVLMSDGRVDAVGSVAEVLGRLDLAPKTGGIEAGAVLDTTVAGSDERYGLTRLRCAAGEIFVPPLGLPHGAPVRVRIRARDVIIAVEKPRGLSALNVLPGRIAEIGAESGAVRDIGIALAEGRLIARVTQRSLVELNLVPGRDVFAVIKSVALDRRSLGKSRSDGDFADAVET